MAHPFWQFTPYTVPVLIAGTITFICATLLWRNGTHRSRYAALLLWDLTVWMAGYALELSGRTLPVKLAGQNMQYAAGGLISLTWVAFVTTYSGLGRWLRREVVIPLAAPAAASIVLMATNRWHGLVAFDLRLDASGPFVTLERTWGVWTYFVFAYTYLLLLLGLLLLVRVYFHAPRENRRQTLLLIIAVAFPWMGSVLDLLDVRPLYGLDFTPFGFLLVGFVITWIILYHHFGEVIPASYETAVESMSDGVLVADRTGRVLSANPAAREILAAAGGGNDPPSAAEPRGPGARATGGPAGRAAGATAHRPVAGAISHGLGGCWGIDEMADRSLGELLAQTAMDLDPPPDGRSRSERMWEREIELTGPEGRRVYSLRRSWVFERHRPVSQVLVFRDITERSKAEASLREAKALAEEANRAKSEFLANMSHELRTPLHHIIGFTELVADGHAGEINEAQEEHLRDVLEASGHLLSLINEILEITRIDAGMLSVDAEQASLREPLEGTLGMIREKALKHGIRVSLESDRLPEVAVVDVRKLRQVLFNLLIRAVSLCPDGGEVRVGMSGGEQAPGAPGRLELKVSIAGLRLADEDYERIFRPFQQMRVDTDHVGLASGGGLALARRLVELQGGVIAAGYSESNQATVFSAQLPLGQID
jgi:signal transduction histidine kinase/PAS domain-containing protein